MTPSKKSVGELLGAYERRPILLPEFQRSYSWEKSQVATFWGDLNAFKGRYSHSPVDSTYFLGPIVLIATTGSGLSISHFCLTCDMQRCLGEM